MINRWNYSNFSEQENEIQNKLAEELSISPVLAQLLVQREIYSFEDARDFFRPDLANLHDPFLMADMDKAVDRLTKAMHSNEKILVYGDYDAVSYTHLDVYKRQNYFKGRLSCL